MDAGAERGLRSLQSGRLFDIPSRAALSGVCKPYGGAFSYWFCGILFGGIFYRDSFVCFNFQLSAVCYVHWVVEQGINTE